MLFKQKQPNKWLNKNILALGFTSLFSDLGHEMTTALLPIFIATLGIPANILGLIEGCANASTSLMKLFAGWYSDYTGKRKSIAATGYFVTALGVAMLPFAATWPQVFLARVIAWLGKGLRKPARDALLADSALPAFYGRMFGFHRAMDSIGAVGGPALAAVLIQYLSIRTTLRISFIPELIAFLTIVCLVSDSVKSAIKRFKFFESIGQLPRSFLSYLNAVLIFRAGNFAISMLLLRAIQLLTPTLGTNTAQSMSIMCYTLYNLIYALGSYPVGYLGDIYNKRIILAYGYGITAVVYACFAFLQPTGVTAIAFLFVLSGSAIAIIDATERAITAELLPENIRGIGFGSLSLIQGIGDFLSSTIVGLIWTYISAEYGFLYAAILCILGALMLVYTTLQRQA